MRLYDTITQSDLNDTIDLLLNNYHREIKLNIDDSTNDFCGLNFDISDGVDAGEEIIFNNGDSLHINVSDKRLALMGYTIRFHYYQLDKGDYKQSQSYGDLQSFTVDLDDNEVTVPFTDNQVYLQKEFDLVLLKDVGYRLLLSSKDTVVPNEDIELTADYTLGSVPVENASVSFYESETLLGVGITDSDGLATFRVSNPSSGSHTFSAVVDGVYSENVSVNVLPNNIMEFSAYYDSFMTTPDSPFKYNGRVFIDWGDDSGFIEYVGGRLSHSFNDGLNRHDVKIYGDITSLELYCFGWCDIGNIIIPNSVTRMDGYCFSSSNVRSIDIPNSVISMGGHCFYLCFYLTSIILHWTNPSEIVTYNSNWIEYTPSSLKFYIPTGTTQLYIDKGYPSNKLVERSS